MKKYRYYMIYKITNLINNKIYIGKHKCDYLDDGYFGSGKLLWLAINKYGIENFIFEPQFILHNQEEMDLLEELVVNKDFLERTDVYNISRGGKNPCLYGKNNPFFGKNHSEEFNKKISLKFKGKHLSAQHKERIKIGFQKLLNDHPEIRLKFASNKGKKKCKNVITNKIKFFKIEDIPEDFQIYINRKQIEHVSEEKKLENKKKKIDRNHRSKWYNNGIQEKFCIVGTQPEGFALGRLPTINIGRKYSKETILKMRNSKLGKPASNKNQVFITNGIENRYISKNEQLPDGWRYGMTHINKEKKV